MNPRHGFRPLTLLILALAAGALLAGCGDDDDPAPQVAIADFAGTWEATSYKATDQSNPIITIDLIFYGARFAMETDPQGAFGGLMYVPDALGGPATVPVEGTLTMVSPDTLQATFTEEYPPYLTDFRPWFSLQGNTLRLRDENTTFDFGAGDVPATFEGFFTRRGAVTLADFEGDWDATMYLIQSTTHEERALELMTVGGSFEFTADAAGAFTGEAFVPAAVAGVDTTIAFQGGFTLVSQSEVSVEFNPEVPPFLTNFTGAMQMLGSMISMVDESGTFDFGFGDEPAVATVIVVKELGS